MPSSPGRVTYTYLSGRVTILRRGRCHELVKKANLSSRGRFDRERGNCEIQSVVLTPSRRIKSTQRRV